MIEKINKQTANCPATIFDTFDVSMDPKMFGNAVRQRIGELSSLFGRINKLATNALLLYEQARNRRDKAEAIAWNQVDKSKKVTEQKILVKTIPIVVDGESTTLNEEEQRVNLYEYVYNRGRDLTKEIAASLDVGRTMLSWDKQEYGKSQHEF